MKRRERLKMLRLRRIAKDLNFNIESLDITKFSSLDEMIKFLVTEVGRQERSRPNDITQLYRRICPPEEGIDWYEVWRLLCTRKNK